MANEHNEIALIKKYAKVLTPIAFGLIALGGFTAQWSTAQDNDKKHDKEIARLAEQQVKMAESMQQNSRAIAGLAVDIRNNTDTMKEFIKILMANQLRK